MNKKTILMNKKTILVMCLALIAMIGNSYALFDQQSLEIRLTDNTGTILSGTYNFSFNIYDVYTDGASLYESNQTLTTDSTGLVSVILKDIDLDFNSNYYLGVIVGTDAEMSPRINITDVGTAINTDNWNNIDTPMNITEMGNFTAYDVNMTNNAYIGSLRATDGNSIYVQPNGDLDDFFSFKTPSNRPTLKREGGKFIYFDSTNVYDVGISLRYDDTYSGTLNYEKDEKAISVIGKNSPVKIKTNSEYNNYFLFETYNHIPQLSAYNATELKIADNLTVDGYIYSTDWTNVSITESQVSDADWYDSVSDIPTATPSNGDTTHLSTADHIYDWGILTFQPLEATLTDIADGTILEDLINTANPWDISTETNLAVGNGITLTDDTLTVVGGTAITADAGGVSVTGDAIGDTQLEYNTGQHLTTTSDVTFNNATAESIIFEADATHYITSNTTCMIFKVGSTTLEICE